MDYHYQFIKVLNALNYKDFYAPEAKGKVNPQLEFKCIKCILNAIFNIDNDNACLILTLIYCHSKVVKNAQIHW